ncbi:MAG TPA: CotH kinase family protein [Candidatus Limnocylindria bacterium]|nr:CotH kinase family protein [Candidatus Limnocylindria bacterium]
MKNRATRLMLLLCVLALAAGGVLSLVSGDAETRIRIFQHRVAAQPGIVPKDEADFATHLPVITLDTRGQDIPGERMEDSEDGDKRYTLAEDGDTRILADFAMYDRGGVNRLADGASMTSMARIRYRGNYSRWFYKKSYTVSLVRDDGQTANPLPLSGLPTHDEWVLHGPWIDRTLIRNYLAYNVAGEIMPWAPGVRFVEMFLDGEYHGVYLLTEPVTRGQGRLQLRKPDSGDNVTSFIVRWDRATKGDQRLNNFIYYTNRADLSALDVRYPGKANITPGRMEHIEKTISRIEKTLYSADMADPESGYYQYLDVESFAQYFVINEFFRNIDAGRYSTFLYKDARGKVGLAVWDFDNAADNYIDGPWGAQGFTMQNSPWFSALLTDSVFVREVISQYRRLRQGALSDEYLLRTIDESVAYLGDAVGRNFVKWERAFDLEDYNGLDYLIPVERNHRSHAEAVRQFKSFLVMRGQWLDEHIDTLLQYAQPSRNTGLLYL